MSTSKRNGSSNNFERYVNMLPIPWERLVAMGVKYLADELEAEEVKFNVATNGVSIGIITDEENKKDAVIFWKEYVVPALEGE